MFRDKVVETLKKDANPANPDLAMSRALMKIKKEERLSSKEFLSVYDALRKEKGVATKYQNPDGQLAHLKTFRNVSDP